MCYPLLAACSCFPPLILRVDQDSGICDSVSQRLTLQCDHAYMGIVGKQVLCNRKLIEQLNYDRRIENGRSILTHEHRDLAERVEFSQCATGRQGAHWFNLQRQPGERGGDPDLMSKRRRVGAQKDEFFHM